MRTSTPKFLLTQPVILGFIATACALLGLLAWLTYALFSSRGIDAAYRRDMLKSARMVSFSGYFSLAQLTLGILAVSLGCAAAIRGGRFRIARMLANSAVLLGILVLVMLFLFV